MSNLKVIAHTILLSMVFFLLLIIVSTSGLFAKAPGLKFDATHLFVALVPFIILLIISGKLKEIRGPGGIELTWLHQSAKQFVRKWRRG